MHIDLGSPHTEILQRTADVSFDDLTRQETEHRSGDILPTRQNGNGENGILDAEGNWRQASQTNDAHSIDAVHGVNQCLQTCRGNIKNGIDDNMIFDKYKYDELV